MTEKKTTIPEFIYHYYDQSVGPFNSISGMEYEEAKIALTKIKKGFNTNRGSNYLDQRITLEKKLKTEFLKLGGAPTTGVINYFTLGACPWLETWFEYPAMIKIPLATFANTKVISFTYPDSMISFQVNSEDKLKKYRKNCSGKLFLWNDLEDLVAEFGIPTQNNWEHVPENLYDRYIEVQIWDNKFLEDLSLYHVRND